MLEGVVEMYSDAMSPEKSAMEVESQNNSSDTHVNAYLATRMIDFLYF